jgi:hypothetical protein
MKVGGEMKTTTEIICDTPEVAQACEIYALKFVNGDETPFVRAVGVEERTLRFVYHEIPLDEEDPALWFEERLTGFRDGVQSVPHEADAQKDVVEVIERQRDEAETLLLALTLAAEPLLAHAKAYRDACSYLDERGGKDKFERRLDDS